MTGNAGFLGRHFTEALGKAGWDVCGFDAADDFRVQEVLGLYAAEIPGVDLVVHCAAVVGGRRTIDGDALRVATENLTIDAAVFDWCARTRPGRLLYLSSSAVYPVHLQGAHVRQYWLPEGAADPGTPDGSPDATYGWVKLTGERLCAELRKAGVPVTVVRPFSGYGTTQSPEYPFRAFVDRALAQLDPFPIWGSAYQVRDWIHVDDVTRMALALCAAGVDGPVNLCSGIPVTMLELASRICAAADYAPRLEVEPSAPMGVAYRVGDPDRMLGYVGRPEVSLDDGIRRAVRGE